MAELGTSTLFEDTIKVNSVDREGKMFQRVSRVEATTELYEVQITLDVNTELYTMQEAEYHSLMLASTISLEGTEDKGYFSIHENYSETLVAKFDYVMYGKIFKHSLERGHLVVHISFGGLLMTLTGQPSDLVQLEPDSNVYLLLKKLY
mmetsp:Transcript_9210/g.13696  ORF Transcript_9210/g.13696 Transcript_9210/m.13696 type:complete len:149 (+) Transcript_9210:6-452(+)